MPSIHAKPRHAKPKSRAHSAQLAITKTADGLIVEGIHRGDKFKITMKNPDPRNPVEARQRISLETRNMDNESDILQDVILSLGSAALQSHQPQEACSIM
jgi:hypothetical protein